MAVVALLGVATPLTRVTNFFIYVLHSGAVMMTHTCAHMLHRGGGGKLFQDSTASETPDGVPWYDRMRSNTGTDNAVAIS